MKSSLVRTFGLALALGFSTAHATLIGDTITVERHYPDLATVLLSQTVVVQAGTADVLTFFPSTFDPEANSFSVGTSAPNFNSFFIPASFNGFVVSGIDDTITGVSVSTNLAGWSDSRIAFDAHSIAMNFQGLTLNGSASQTSNRFTLTLNFAPAGVPDSGTTAVLLGLAVLGLVAMRRRMG